MFPSKNFKKIVLSYIGGFVSTTFTFYIPKNNGKDLSRSRHDVRRPIEEKVEHCPQWLLPLGAWLLRLGAFVAYLVQQLVFAVVAGPLALAVTVLYACGLVITTGIAAWRLLRRDYGGGGGGNMWAALDVLYTLVLVQGVLSYYRFSSRFCQERLALDVAKAYSFPDPEAYESNTQRWRYYTVQNSLRRYVRETRIGCENDPSFAKGRNLVKYAVDAMDDQIAAESSNWSRSRFIHGASILDVLLSNPRLEEQHRLIKKHLISSPSSGELLRKLMQLLDSAVGYPKMYGVWIMTHLASDLRPDEQLPAASQLIHLIASLLEAPGEDERNTFYFMQEVIVEVLRLLEKLVAADDGWCHAVAEKEGLLANIMLPLRSDLQHTKYHGHDRDWMPTRGLIGASIQVMRRLVNAPGATGDKLRREISGSRDAMASMERILRCDQCNDCLLMQGVLEIYTKLGGGPSIIATRRKHLIKKLVLIFTDQRQTEGSMLLAGEMLATLSSQGVENIKIILQAKPDVVADLTRILEEKNTKCRIIAAQILEQLCIHHTDYDDEYVQNLKKDLKVTMPKVVCLKQTKQKLFIFRDLFRSNKRYLKIPVPHGTKSFLIVG